MKLRKYINELHCRISSEISWINQGGCVHFAYYFSKKLRQLGIKHSIVLIDYCYIDEKQFNKYGANHVTVYIPKIGLVDGEHVRKERDYPYKEFSEHSKLSFKVRHKDVWNDWYDTRQNNKVRKIIKEVFDDY